MKAFAVTAAKARHTAAMKGEKVKGHERRVPLKRNPEKSSSGLFHSADIRRRYHRDLGANGRTIRRDQKNSQFETTGGNKNWQKRADALTLKKEIPRVKCAVEEGK